MALFPQHFIEDLKAQADIVTVIQDYVSLRRTGATYKGLCPFHGEKTPSFHVNRERGFFHCFGCGVGGDVFKFLELHDKVGFQDAVKQLASRFGLSIPEPEDQTDEQRASAAERESLLKVHEVAAAWFREQFATPAAARVRKQLAERGLTDATIEALGIGFAPPGRDPMIQALRKAGYSPALIARAGLAVQRDDGSIVDRFRNRLMIPICRDTGSVIAFGGRSIDPDQQPKYLNSPETPIYSKGRTLYGLNLSKAAMRTRGFAVLVEGYFDFGAVHQAGFPAVASCGTALTPQQAQQLRRFAGKVVLSFDPDAAGQGAAEKSCEMLVAEGFEVNVAVLPPGDDPDTYVRKHGHAGYAEILRQSRPYLEYLLDRAAARHNLSTAEGRARLVEEMLPVGSRLTERVRRELFVEMLAGRAGVSGDSIFAELRRLAPNTASNQPGRSPHAASGTPDRPRHDAATAFARVTKAEKGLLWALIHHPQPALEALGTLSISELEGLAARSVLDLALQLNEDKKFSPAVLLERLTMGDAQLVTAVASEPEPPTLGLGSCVREIRRGSYERTRGALQREIDQLQRNGEANSPAMDALLTRKGELARRIQALVISEE